MYNCMIYSLLLAQFSKNFQNQHTFFYVWSELLVNYVNYFITLQLLIFFLRFLGKVTKRIPSRRALWRIRRPMWNKRRWRYRPVMRSETSTFVCIGKLSTFDKNLVKMNNNKLNWLAASASLRVVALFCLFFSAVSTYFAKSVLQSMGSNQARVRCLKKCPIPDQ